MELKEGYKRTEVGVIPSDWKVLTINQIGTINGRVGWKGYTKKDLRLSGAYTIGAKHIDKANRLDLSDPTFLSQEKFLESPEIMVMKDDILIVQRGTIGKVVVVDREIGDATINPSMLILRFKDIVSSPYVFCYLISNGGQNQILLDTSSTGVPMITQRQVGAFQIPLPPTKSEQTAIATALSDADALITGLEKLIAKKRAIKQGAMQELLKPKKGWVVKRLGDTANILRGGSPRPIEDYLTTDPNGINWIKIGDVGKSAKYIESTEEKIIHEGMTRSRFVNEGDFLLSNSMSFGRPYILKTKGCIHDGWLVIQDYQEHFNIDFLYYVLGSELVLSQYKAMAAGSSVLNLNKEIVKKVLINCPETVKEQADIAATLSDIDNEIWKLERKLDKATVLKQGMMQNLLTGKIRLA